MNSEIYKISTIQFLIEKIEQDLKTDINIIQQNIENIISNPNNFSKENFINSFKKIILSFINKKTDDLKNLKPIEFSFLERLIIDFLWFDIRIFKNGNNIYKNLSEIIENKFSHKNLLFFSDFIKDKIETEIGLKEYFNKKRESKSYEEDLFKLEDEKNKFAKLRESLLYKLTGADDNLIKKYLTQSMKLEQEIPHIAEYNWKKRQGVAISPKERDNLLRLEKEIEEDEKWREVVLSNFLKINPQVVYDIRKINKSINAILEKQGEINYYINLYDKFFKDFENKKLEISNSLFQKIENYFDNFFKNYSTKNFLPISAENIILNFNLKEAIDNILKNEEKFIKSLETRKKEIPNILLLPFIDTPKFLKDLNIIIIPLYSNSINNLYFGWALFKWEMDTIHNVKTEFCILKQNRGIAPEILKKKFLEKYFYFLYDKEKFKKTEQTEILQFFENIFK